MTTMQIGKDNCLQISYLKDISAWVSELDRQGMFSSLSLGSAQLSQSAAPFGEDRITLYS